MVVFSLRSALCFAPLSMPHLFNGHIVNLGDITERLLFIHNANVRLLKSSRQ
jgi:hypothetical protein